MHRRFFISKLLFQPRLPAFHPFHHHSFTCNRDLVPKQNKQREKEIFLKQKRRRRRRRRQLSLLPSFRHSSRNCVPSSLGFETAQKSHFSVSAQFGGLIRALDQPKKLRQQRALQSNRHQPNLYFAKI